MKRIFFDIHAQMFSNLIFGTSAEQGDYVEIVCDGAKWYFYGNAAKDGAVTTS